MAATSYPNSTDQMTYQKDQKEDLAAQTVHKKIAKYILNKIRTKASTVNGKEKD